MIPSYILFELACQDDLQGRILILTAAHAHAIMNIPADLQDAGLFLLKAKASEFLNNPVGFKEKMTLSVMVLLPDEAFGEKDRTDSSLIDDEDLILAIPDAFDALAGVTPE